MDVKMNSENLAKILSITVLAGWNYHHRGVIGDQHMLLILLLAVLTFLVNMLR